MISETFLGPLEFIGRPEHSDKLLAKTVAILAFLIQATLDQMRDSLELVLKLATEETDIHRSLFEQVVAFYHRDPSGEILKFGKIVQSFQFKIDSARISRSYPTKMVVC